MPRRAVTLLELLLALAILTMLTAGFAAWVNVTARLASSHDEASWTQAAEATLRLLHDELVMGDIAPDIKRDDPAERLSVGDNTVRFETRAPGMGAVTVVYGLDVDSGWLTRNFQEATGEGNGLASATPSDTSNTPSGGPERRLLRSVTAFDAQVLTGADSDRSWLDVSIRSTDGASATRRYLLR